MKIIKDKKDACNSFDISGVTGLRTGCGTHRGCKYNRVEYKAPDMSGVTPVAYRIPRGSTVGNNYTPLTS